MDTNYQSILNDATAVISAKDLIIEDIDGNSLVYLDGDGNLAPVTFGSGVSFTDGELSATGSVYNVVSADSNIESKTSGYTTTLTLSRTPTLRYIDFTGVNSPDIRSLLATNNTGRLISIVTSNGVNYDYNDISGIGTISLSGSPSLSGLTLGTYNGLLKATSGVVSTATAGTDYQAAFTTGTSSQFFRGDLSLVTLDTDSIPEGKTNQYFTTARARGAFTAGSGIDITSGVISSTGGIGTFEPIITPGSATQYWTGSKTWVTLDTSNVPENTNLYYTTSRFNTAFSGKTTDDLAEGKTNQYFTNARAVTACSGAYEPVITGSTSNKFFDGTKTFRTVTQADVSGLTTSDTPTFANLVLSGITINKVVYTGMSGSLYGLDLGNSLSVVYSVLDTIQDIRTSASPTFTGLNLSGLTASRMLLTDGSKNLISATTGSSLSLSGSTLDAIQDIRTTATPQFTRLGLGIASLSYMGVRIGSTVTGAASTNVYGILLGSNMNITTTGYGAFGLSMGFNNFDIPSAGAYNVFGIDINGSSMTKSGTGTITYSMAARLLSPNIGASYAVGCGTDSLSVSSNPLPWTDRASAVGCAYISNLLAVGALPSSDRSCYVKNTTQTYGVFTNSQPTSSAGSTTWYGNYIYTSTASLSGGSANIYGLYVNTVAGGATANCVASYGGYFNNIGASTTTANNFALFAQDLCVGSATNKQTNGIYCSGNIRVDGLATASRLLYCDANKILTSAAVSSNLSFSAGTLDTIQGIQTSSSPTFAGLNLSGLTANSLVATDGSKNLTTTISGLSPTLSNLSITNGLGIGTGGYNSNCLVQATGDRLYGYYHNLYSTLSSTTVNRYGYYTLFDNSGLSGTATVNWYGVYSETSTSGSARVGNSYGGYFKSGASSTAANNISLYADDLSVGASNGKVTSGIYSSGGIRLGNSANAAMTIYKEGSGTYNYLGGFAGTRSIAIKYVIVGKMVTLSFGTDYSTFTSTSQISMSAGILPSEIRPASTKYLPMVVWANNTWATGAITMYTDGGILLVRDNWSAFTNGLINGFINTSITYELT